MSIVGLRATSGPEVPFWEVAVGLVHDDEFAAAIQYAKKFKSALCRWHRKWARVNVKNTTAGARLVPGILGF
jgi:hypothetical protein